MDKASFSDRLNSTLGGLTPGERRVADYLLENREAAIIASAADLAQSIGTSDATIIRTARRLGFSGLDDLRRALASDLRRDLSLSDRLENSLDRVAGAPGSALSQTLAVVRRTLDAVEEAIAGQFDPALEILCSARRLRIFGIGPSGHIAGYFAQQLGRLGMDAMALRQTGLQFADDLLNLQKGDAVIALAYDRPYPEVTALFDRAIALGLPVVLITSPGPLRPDHRADITLTVPRGQSDGFGIHAGTVALIEALLVGYAGLESAKVRQNLDTLNALRQSLSGDRMNLPQGPQVQVPKN